jgi:hypothetical protein
MPPARSTASHASVAYLRIPEFAQRGVAEEAHLKERLEKVVAQALPVLRADEYIVLDAPEGLAVVVLANPRGALRFAWRAVLDGEIEPAIGLAHGPVRVAQGQPPVLYGDALIAAEGAAKATNPGRVSASRDFRDALTRVHPGMRRLLVRSGSAVDDQGRAHEIFRADERTAMKRRQLFFATTAFIAVGIVGAGFVIKATRPPPPPPPAPIAPPAPEVVPGAVTFDVKPEGEIWVDGTFKGKSPPLKKIQVPAGNHTIEVRSGNFKPMTAELTVGQGEEFAVEHNFIAKAPPKAPVKSPTKILPKPKPQAQPRKGSQQDKGIWDRFVDWFKGQERNTDDRNTN